MKLTLRKSFKKNNQHRFLYTERGTILEVISRIKFSTIYYFFLHLFMVIIFVILIKHEITLISLSDQINLHTNTLNLLTNKINLLQNQIEELSSTTKLIINKIINFLARINESSQAAVQTSTEIAKNIAVNQPSAINYIYSYSLTLMKMLGSIALYQLSNQLVQSILKNGSINNFFKDIQNQWFSIANNSVENNPVNKEMKEVGRTFSDQLREASHPDYLNSQSHRDYIESLPAVEEKVGFQALAKDMVEENSKHSCFSKYETPGLHTLLDSFRGSNEYK